MSLKLANPQEAKAILDGNDEAVYLDVRTEAEFAVGHPTGAVNVPAFLRTPSGMQPNPDFVTAVQALFAIDCPIICGCQAGGRSEAAGRLLIGAGYTHVTNLIGGYGGGRDPRTGQVVVGWEAAGLPTTRK